jgi:hypothetical protein
LLGLFVLDKFPSNEGIPRGIRKMTKTIWPNFGTGLPSAHYHQNPTGVHFHQQAKQFWASPILSIIIYNK